MNIKNETTYFFFACWLLNLVFFSLQGKPGTSEFSLAKRYEESTQIVTDRNIYFRGEIIWFHALCNDKQSPKKAGISKVLYIEVGTPQQGALIQKKVVLKNGSASGGIEIPKHATSGNYYMHAYTKQIINQSTGASDLKILTIINPDKVSTNHPSDRVPEPVQFWPLPQERNKNKTGFYITRDAIAYNVSLLTIVTENDSVISYPEHFGQGLGTIDFPTDQDTIYLKINTHSGDSMRYQIPAFGKAPLETKLEYNEKGVYVLLPSEMQGKGESLIITDINGQLLVNKKTINTRFFIPNDSIASNALHIIVKDQQRQTISESWALINTPDYVAEPTIKMNDSIFFPGETIKIFPDETKTDFLTGAAGIVMEGTLYSKKSIPRFALRNKRALFTYLHSLKSLSDEVKEQAELFLYIQSNEKNEEGVKPINLFQSETPFIPEFREVSISGVVLNPKTGKALSQAEVILTILQDTTQLQYYTTADDGKFIFSVHKLEGFKDIALVATHSFVNSPEILINQDFNTNFTNLPELFYYKQDFDLNKLNPVYINAQVKTAFSQNQIAQQYKPDLAEQFGDPTHEYILDNYIKMPTMTETIDEIVLPLKIKTIEGKKQFLVWDDERNMYYEKPLVLLDNMPIRDIDGFLKINPAAVEKISVINTSYLLGDKILRGIVQIKTRNGDFAGHSFTNNPVYLEYQTVEPEAFFIQIQKESNHTPRFLNTVTWSKITPGELEETSIKAPDNEGIFEVNYHYFSDKSKIEIITEYFRVR